MTKRIVRHAQHKTGHPAHPETEPVPPSLDGIAETLTLLRSEVRTMRATQLRMMQALAGLRHEFNHRSSTHREELGAYVKASHAELSEHFQRFAEALVDHEQRLSDLNRVFGHLFSGGD